jgi:methionine synthase II (cobalamin-independent)
MFATLFGGLPRPPLDAGAPPAGLVEAAVRAQEDAGLELLSDGELRGEPPSVAGWEATASLTSLAVKQAVLGPYSSARATATGADAAGTRDATLAATARLNRLCRDLAAAGCPLIEVHEPAAVHIGADEAERARFREAHRRLLDGVADTHRSLVVTGGSADGAGVETMLAAPYHSLGVDLIAGPDNWRLVTASPGIVGIVCGALSPSPDSDDGPEMLLWAAGYAASSGGRGPDRVGLATASSLAGLSWPAAVEKLTRLGAAARLAVAPRDERLRGMDPRAIDSRAAALGAVETPSSHPPDRGDDAT